MGSVIVAYIWKWLPFWTVIFLAGRMAIPKELYEAADVDGATGLRRFVHITFPMMANLYHRLHPALDHLDARRLQHGPLRQRRRPGAADPCAGDARHPRCVRAGRSAHGHGGRDLRAAVADPAGDLAHAQAVEGRGAAVTAAAGAGAGWRTPAPVLIGVLIADLDAGAALQHGPGRGAGEGGRVQHQRLAAASELDSFRAVFSRELLVARRISGARWATASISASRSRCSPWPSAR